MAKPYSAQYVPPYDFVLVSTGAVGSDVALPLKCRGLLIGVAGNLNITMANGNTRDNVPFIEGINPGYFSVVRTGGSATNIWAVI